MDSERINELVRQRREAATALSEATKLLREAQAVHNQAQEAYDAAAIAFWESHYVARGTDNA